MNHERYAAYAAGVQAFGLVLALGLGAWTLDISTRNQAVDRVLALHAELTTGEVDRARRNLAEHLRNLGSDAHVRVVSGRDLRSDSALKTYPGDRTYTPLEDAVVVVRFFQRVRVAQVLGSLDDEMTVALIGEHAAWWNRAILDRGHSSRRALSDLAEWVDAYSLRDAWSVAAREDWRARLEQDFDESP
jgi:hypothetical protein